MEEEAGVYLKVNGVSSSLQSLTIQTMSHCRDYVAHQLRLQLSGTSVMHMSVYRTLLTRQWRRYKTPPCLELWAVIFLHQPACP